MATPNLRLVETEAAEGEFRMVPHSCIKPYSRQPRTFFSEKDIAELAASIDGAEQVTPIIITLVPSENTFTIVGGNVVGVLAACSQNGAGKMF